jgi:hypothetical protein
LSFVRYIGLSQLRYSGLSLTSACLFWHNSEISGFGVRGSGRYAADAAYFFMGNLLETSGIYDDLSHIRYSGLSLTSACLFWHNSEISEFGVREGMPLMRHIFLWGFCTGWIEKPVNVVKNLPPGQRGGERSGQEDYRCKAHIGLTDEIYPCQMTLSVRRVASPNGGSSRKAGEGGSLSYKSKMR